MLTPYFIRPSVTVIIYNPDHDSQDWSSHPTLNSIELKYRRSGAASWMTAINSTGSPVLFATAPSPVIFSSFRIHLILTLCFQGSIDYGFAQAVWDTTYLTDDTYELMTVVKCRSSGLSFPPPGIDSYESASIFGVINRVAEHVVAIATQPQNGIYLSGDEISVTFNQPINCDTPRWFNLVLRINDTTIVTPEMYSVFCQDDTIFAELKSDKVNDK